jgi:hypothetical protein
MSDESFKAKVEAKLHELVEMFRGEHGEGHPLTTAVEAHANTITNQVTQADSPALATLPADVPSEVNPVKSGVAVANPATSTETEIPEEQKGVLDT